MIVLGAYPADWLSIVALLSAVAVMSCRRLQWRRHAAMLLALAVVAMLGSFAIFGPRWQMMPAALSLVILSMALAISAGARGHAFFRDHRYLRRLGIAGLLVLPVGSLACSFLFPLFTLPAPTGPFAVGTTRLALTDDRRREAHVRNSDARRELMVGIWYPAAFVPGARPAALFPASDVLGRTINEASWPFGWLLSHLDRIATHSIVDAPVARTSDRFPVILFSHGLGSLGVQNMTLFETLASRGYVVISIEHSYGNLATIFPDGHAAGFRSRAYDAQDRALDAAKEAALERAITSEDMAQIADASREIVRLMPNEARSGRAWYDYWSADQRFVASQVAAMQAGAIDGRFKGRLDPSRIAFTGMSFGGAAAQLSCARDPRCRAGINMDGYRAILVEAPGQNAPFLYFNSRQLNVNRQFLERDRNQSYWIKLTDAEHYDYSDISLISPALRWVGLSGPGSSPEKTAVINAYVVAFLDEHLMGRPSGLLSRQTAPWPNIRFATNVPPHISRAPIAQGALR